ncbi:MAG: protein-disulfide reductase DsbD family protein [Candidatus Pseudobacter hemicellulosilyticus]|uniref:Protein-disulfide reductase DsbD family protein n=1 Tax=Candidatus Pseudobacter hemicellulosilyticus TaxID=3121375 RepID=A0AAJ5WT57_9BACT|nr:MAG: protein-disulfide reductase DsbD family protein [Pseudobacter sp.]
MVKQFLLMATLLIGGLYAMAQDPVKWQFSAKKTGDNMYEVRLTATVDNGWHIYSQSTPDGGPAPTVISFAKNPLLTITGKPKEMGKLEQKHEEVFGVDVKYYNNKVDFVQLVKVKGAAKTNISGTVSFMACTDEQCLPPKDIPFSIKL